MAHITDNLILEVCAAAVAPSAMAPLQGSIPGYRTFASKCVDLDTVHYLIRAVDVVGRPTGQWELGRGAFRVVSSNPFLERVTVLDSSAGGAAIDFAAGPKYITLSQLAATTDQIRVDQQIAMGLDFVGQIAAFAMSTPPSGWLKANGAAISRTAYPRLFARIGVTFGAGDGATTFNLPDARGEFLRGWDDGRAVDSGRAFGSFQAGQNLSHTHGVTDPGHAHSIADPGHAHSAWTDSQGSHNHGVGWKGTSGGTSGYMDTANGSSSGYATTDLAGAHTHNVGVAGAGTGIGIYGNYAGVSVQASGGAEVRPRNLAVLVCVKF